MNYLDPTKVISPKDHWRLIDILCDYGEGEFSIALGEWDSCLCIASRWNGSLSNEQKKGNPISNFQPTWFVLPDLIAEATLKDLLIKHAEGKKGIHKAVLDRALSLLRKADGGAE